MLARIPAKNLVSLWGINMFYIKVLIQLISVCMSFTCMIINVKERNINGFTGWFTAFIFEVAFYGNIHGLLLGD